MRLSDYTSILPLNEKFNLVYSAKADKFIVCHNKLLSISDDRTVLAGTDQLCSQLRDIDALKDDAVDEVNQIKEMIDRVDNDERTFYLHVNPTLNCNFRCWYCYEEHQPKSKMSEETMANIVSLVKSEFKSNPKLETVILSFFGGEPLMFFNQIAGKLIEAIKSLCENEKKQFQSHFTTNAYLLNDSIIAALKGVDVGFQITLDGGRQFHDKVRFTSAGGGSYDLIMGNIKKLARDAHYIVLRINYTSDNIDSIKEIIVDLEEFDDDIRKYIQVDFQRVWQNRPTITESEILSKISAFVAQLQDEKYSCAYASNIGPTHVRRSCYGDKKKHLLINYDGNVYFCTARDFKPQNSAGKLTEDGTIEWNEEKLNRFSSCKFSRKVCHRCRIAPLCGGGCRQRATEAADDGKCLYGYTESDLDSMIMNRFQMRYLR